MRVFLRFFFSPSAAGAAFFAGFSFATVFAGAFEAVLVVVLPAPPVVELGLGAIEWSCGREEGIPRSMETGGWIRVRSLSRMDIYMQALVVFGDASRLNLILLNVINAITWVA